MCLFREVLSKPIQFPGAYKQLHHLSVPKRVPEVIKWLNVPPEGYDFSQIDV